MQKKLVVLCGSWTNTVNRVKCFFTTVCIVVKEGCKVTNWIYHRMGISRIIISLSSFHFNTFFIVTTVLSCFHLHFNESIYSSTYYFWRILNGIPVTKKNTTINPASRQVKRLLLYSAELWLKCVCVCNYKWRQKKKETGRSSKKGGG